ncbi:MAG: Uma2 family endonuclease [Chloroflexi bacterium]|nr:Uma2 family endonuclease [Chloroflexota bacterium]
MQNTKLKFTCRDYLLLPEGDRRELLEGDFYVVPGPSFRHQTISRNLGRLLWEFVRRNGLGQVVWAPFDVVLSPESVVQPDILFVSNDRCEIITKDNISGAPDLVIEILSPSTAERDRELKLTLYTRYGVQEYWIVDPEDGTVQVMVLGADRSATARTYDSGFVESGILPELIVPLDEIFSTD